MELTDPIPVLDSGYVQLIAFMGDDDAIANAARVSYAKGTKTKRDNAALVRFLMRHQHYSPFGQCQVQFKLRLPLFVFAQLVRHDRFIFNCMSGRYSVMPEEKWSPKPEEIRGQGKGNKQVGNGQLDKMRQLVCHDDIQRSYEQVTEAYNSLLALGVAREQARTVLPMGQYTEGVVTANLGDWMLFLRQRLDSHAQQEIRVYAEAISSVLDQLFPVAMQAFRDYQLNAVVLTAAELALVSQLVQQAIEGATTYGVSDDAIDEWLGEYIPTKREITEFRKKMDIPRTNQEKQ